MIKTIKKYNYNFLTILAQVKNETKTGKLDNESNINNVKTKIVRMKSVYINRKSIIIIKTTNYYDIVVMHYGVVCMLYGCAY
jgi:hypothetical protein